MDTRLRAKSCSRSQSDCKEHKQDERKREWRGDGGVEERWRGGGEMKEKRWRGGGEMKDGTTARSDEYTASPLHLAHRFDALEVNMLEGGVYEDLQFDESEQGFFIDDDLLYEDILGPPEEEIPLEDFYESDNCSDCSWGSEEWDTYDSEQEEMVHSYVDATDHSPKGAVERGGEGGGSGGGAGGNHVGSSHRRSMVSTYSMEKAPQREEAKRDMQMGAVICEVSIGSFEN
ncbi:uncharacterized protein LOC129275773 [Lytechinus pictus]|uniref:uncharacterized protein LOC129275773 n=1 Tax=Lytechinus pictus TaxID=7653 RepID=UPI0030B9E932